MLISVRIVTRVTIPASLLAIQSSRQVIAALPFSFLTVMVIGCCIIARCGWIGLFIFTIGSHPAISTFAFVAIVSFCTRTTILAWIWVTIISIFTIVSHPAFSTSAFVAIVSF